MKRSCAIERLLSLLGFQFIWGAIVIHRPVFVLVSKR